MDKPLPPVKYSNMRRTIRIGSLVFAVVAVSGWLWLGANRGWTKNSVTTFQTDEVTGIEAPVIEARFVPGVDLLGLSLLAVGVVFAVTFIGGSRSGR